MDFQNRQYDPQLGRFLSLDPMADAAGQQGLSPYHAMACNPSTMVDPLGLAAQYSATLSNPNVNMAPAGLAMVEGQPIMLGASLLGGGVSDMMCNLSQTMDEAHHDHQVMTLYYQLVAAEGSANAQSTSVQTQAKAVASAQMAYAIFEPFVAGGNNESSENGDKGITEQNGRTTISLTPGYPEDENFNKYGVRVVLTYTGDLSAYSTTNWIQTVISSRESQKGDPAFKPFNDHHKGSPAPFYYNSSKNDYRNSLRKEFGGETYYDFPNAAGGEFHFMARTSLVGLNSHTQKWETITTVDYGFYMDRGFGITFYPTSNPFFMPGDLKYYHNMTLTNLNK